MWKSHKEGVTFDGCFIVDAMRPDTALSFSFDGAGCGLFIEQVDDNEESVNVLNCNPSSYFDCMPIHKNSEQVAALAVSFLSAYPPEAMQEILRMAEELQSNERDEISLEEITHRVRNALGR